MSKALVRADVRAMLSGLPDRVDVSCGGESTPGAFDNADDQEYLDADGARVKVNGRVLRVTAGDLTGLTRGAAVTIDDGATETAYTVREVLRDNDGLEQLVQLVGVT